jgi:hypothetical protein
MGQSPEALGLRPNLSDLPSEVRDLIRHGSRDRHAGCSDALVEVCAAMFRADFGVDEIWMVLTDPTNAVSAAFFSRDGQQGEAYLERIISQAHDLTKRKEPTMT